MSFLHFLHFLQNQDTSKQVNKHTLLLEWNKHQWSIKYTVDPWELWNFFLWERSPHLLISEFEFPFDLWILLPKSSGSVQQGRDACPHFVIKSVWELSFCLVSTWIPQDSKWVWIYRKYNCYIVTSSWALKSGPQEEDVLQMWMLWENIYSVFRIDHSYEHSYWGETVYVWTLWESIHSVFTFE